MAFKKLTAGLMASSMILGLAATASAEITTATPYETAAKMNKLGVVLGVGTNPDGSIDFNLGGNLTRAELVTTIVRSFGAESAAQLAKGAPSFADVTADAWYSGYVAVAKNLAAQAGTTIGRDSNTFDPNANVSKAEALVFVMKFLGIKVESTGANWYEAWIAKAIDLGMISADDAAIALANPANAALRGEAFVILDFGYSAKVLEGGKSLYTGFVDSAAPTVTVAAPAESTAEAKITVSGSVSDNKAVASVAVNGTAVEVKDGNFTADVALTLGANTVTVAATDIAGNTATKSFNVSRVNAAAAGLEAADITVAAGGEASVAVKVLDANGAEISGVEITGESTVGTFAGGKFTAGTKAGAGTLTLKYGELTKEVKVTVTAGALAKVEAANAGAPGAQIQLKATDAYGNAVSGATFSQTSADALLDANTGVFIASKAGTYDVTATKGDVTVNGQVGVYDTVKKLGVSAPTEIIGNNSSLYEVKVSALDKNGNLVANYGEATGTETMEVELTVPSGAGILQPNGTFAETGTATFNNGVAVFKVKANGGLVDSTFTLEAGLNTDLDVDYEAIGSTEVSVVGQVATSLKVSSAPAYMAANDADGVTIIVDVLDQVGKKMLNGVYDLDIKVTGAATLENDAETDTIAWSPESDASKSFQIYAKDGATVGAVNITVSAEGLGTATATVSAQIPLEAKKLQLIAPSSTEQVALSDADAIASSAVAKGKVLEYSVQVTDKNGVPVKEENVDLALVFGDVDYDDAVWVSTDGGDTWVDVAGYDSSVNTLTTDENGQATFYVTGSVVDTFTVKVAEDSVSPALSSSATSSISVKAGDVDLASFDTSAQLNVLRGNPTKATLSASVTDKYGNAVAVSGVKITFKADTDAVKLNGEAEEITVTTDAEGTAVVELTAPAYFEDDVVVTIDSVKLGKSELAAGDADSVTVSSSYLLPAKLTAAVKVGEVAPSFLTAGQTFDIVLTVKDNEGLAYEDLELTDLRLYVNGVKKTGFTAEVGATAGTYVLHVNTGVVKTLGTADLKVAIANLQESLSVTKSIAVRAGAPAAVKVVESTRTDDGDNLWEMAQDTFEVTVKKNTRTAFTLQVVDQYGNAVTGGAVTAALEATLAEGTIEGDYIQFTNEAGVPLTDGTLTIAKGKIQNKFFLMTDADGTFTITTSYGILTINVVVEK